MRQLGTATTCKKKLKCVKMESSDSGYFENGAKELLESDGSVDGFTTRTSTYGSYKKKPDQIHDRGYNDNNKRSDYEAGGGGATTQLKHNLRSRNNIRNNGTFDQVQEEISSCSNKKIKHDLIQMAPRKYYECSICHELLDTHQALGGHKMKHKRAGGSIVSRHKINGELSSSMENENNTTSTPKTDHSKIAAEIRKTTAGAKKTKGGHKCPFCPKVFRSGQALGGHKRSHMIGSGSSVLERSVNPAPPVVKQMKPTLTLLDLNLPAPVEEEANGHAHFMSW